MVLNFDHLQPGTLRRFGNSLVAIKLSSANSADGISIIEQWMPFGDSPPKHFHHREDEVFHILQGSLRLAIGDNVIIASSGDTLVAPKNIPHTFRADNPSGAHFLTIVRGGDFEAMVIAASYPTDEWKLPQPTPPDADTVQKLETLCRKNYISIIGPPML